MWFGRKYLKNQEKIEEAKNTKYKQGMEGTYKQGMERTYKQAKDHQSSSEGGMTNVMEVSA